MLEELYELFGEKPLDCEFAVTAQDGEEWLWLLQARPLVLAAEPYSANDQHDRLMELISERVDRGMQPHPFLMGRRTVYGVMPDWNPAEIVGVRPKPLSLSLYRDLITDNIWAYQRHNYGYRNLRSFPLMPNFHGLPYIDARLSFNSFIPPAWTRDWPVVWLTTISSVCLMNPLCTTKLNSRSYFRVTPWTCPIV